MAEMIRYMVCETHGNTKWQGHIMCDDCGRVFQTKQSKAPLFAPQVCPCGQKLLPPQDVAIGDDILGTYTDGILVAADGARKTTHADADWRARAICWLCFRRYARKHNGRVPQWADSKRRAN